LGAARQATRRVIGPSGCLAVGLIEKERARLQRE
jgi:hypothetical protein